VTVDSEWAVRNLGIDETSSADAREELDRRPRDDQALARELIDFDSEGPELKRLGATVKAASTGLSRFVDIEWPAGLSPTPGKKSTGKSLPHADVLIVTWTVDEGHALSRVLTPGFDSKNDWKPYAKNFSEIASEMRPGAPALQARRLGTYWTTTIGKHSVTLFKSDSHMSQDGPKLPNARVWKQIIEDCNPQWVITTGTGGGIGTQTEVGDVVVSRFVTFDCQRQFKRFNGDSFASPQDPPAAHFTLAKSLFGANAKFLPTDNPRAPEILTAAAAPAGVLTTDFFGFDNTDDTYKLEGKGGLSEMGDAILGMVCEKLGAKAPQYVMVRNVSDPQIDSKGLTLAQQTKLAADIYKGYGRWSSVCSAIVCWAIVAGL
jgi:nucleoside phosphorylase